jgi:NADH-quinone oxidoreductase subunit L/multicomponent Na+:H+ antiporter subunit D
MWAFGVAAAGMAGIPVLAGFVSKSFLLIGTVESGNQVFAGALLVSGVLNIAYFWPVVYTAFFETPEQHDDKPLISSRYGGRDSGSRHLGDGGVTGKWSGSGGFGRETTWFILGPILVVTLGAVVLGVVPESAVFLRIVRVVVASTTGVVT